MEVFSVTHEIHIYRKYKHFMFILIMLINFNITLTKINVYSSIKTILNSIFHNRNAAHNAFISFNSENIALYYKFTSVIDLQFFLRL